MRTRAGTPSPGPPARPTPASRSLPAAPRRVGRALAFAVAALAAAPAAAQHGFVAPEDRPLHVRLAAASIVAIATVADVGTGRIAFESAEPVIGRIAPSFELKRAPSNPPPWVAGDRVLLLLDGARSPYRWVDKPIEASTLPDAAAERRFAAAVRDLAAVRTDAKARRDLYARWSDGPDEDLAAVGQRGLMDVGGMTAVMDEPFALDRVRVASDPARRLPVRRRAARIAARNPAGIAALLAYVERTLPDTDPKIVETALRAGFLARDPAFDPCLVQLLDTPEGELGSLGFRLAGLAGGPTVERKLSELAVGHPDEEVRNDAVQALRTLRRNHPQPGG
jgi:hypothetical protein